MLRDVREDHRDNAPATRSTQGASWFGQGGVGLVPLYSMPMGANQESALIEKHAVVDKKVQQEWIQEAFRSI